MGAPPVEGALQESVTLTVLLGPLAERPVGAPGVVDGVAEAWVEVAPDPRAFMANTRNR
jgi:hypothetical protein